MSGTIGASRFVSRAEWGARPPKQPLSSNITPTGNTAHYEGTHLGWPWDHSRCAQMVRAIQAYHMDHNDWNDIAYSSVECGHQYIFEGRWVGHRSAANGTDASNQHQYAHCVLIGEGDAFSDEAKQALHDVFEFFVQHGSGTGAHVHSDWYNTSCPGDLVRAYVRAGLPVAQPTPQPTPQPSPVVGPAKELDVKFLTCPDPGSNSSSDYWACRIQDGGVYAKGKAPYLGGLNSHPDWQAGGDESMNHNQVQGFFPALDAQGHWGYVIVTFDDRDNDLHEYGPFPRDGSLGH